MNFAKANNYISKYNYSGFNNLECISCGTPSFFDNSKEGLSPLVSNFNIRNEELKRVYFESSEIITATNFNGFKIGDKRIISVKINSGKTKGHYFTVATPFTFWDNNLIRYEGGSDLENIENYKLHNFTLKYILNNIDEPKTNINYYVSVSGNDSNNGLSEDSAWRTISKAGATVEAGSTVWIKAGDYGAENVIIKNSGFYTKPIKFIGYKTTIGDNPYLERTISMAFESSEMPLLKNGNGAGIECTYKKYIIIRNIQIENFSEYGLFMNSSNYFVADNVFIRDVEYGIRTIDNRSTNNRVKRSYIANCGRVGIRLGNKNNLIDDVWAISSKSVDMDYYISIYGGLQGGNNTIRNSYVKRFPYDSHTGHGISLKGGKPEHSIEYSLVENCHIDGPRGALEFRHSNVQFCVARNILFSDGGNRSNAGGIKFQNGANHNLVEKSIINNTDFGIRMKYSNEYVSGVTAGDNNKVINCIFTNCNTWLLIKTGKSGSANEFINNTIENCDILTSIAIPFDKSNKLINNMIMGVRKNTPGSSDILFTNNNFWNVGFSLPKGIDNISVDPKLDDSLMPTKSTPTTVSSGGVEILDVNYDMNGVERAPYISIGAFEN